MSIKAIENAEELVKLKKKFDEFRTKKINDAAILSEEKAKSAIQDLKDDLENQGVLVTGARVVCTCAEVREDDDVKVYRELKNVYNPASNNSIINKGLSTFDNKLNEGLSNPPSRMTSMQRMVSITHKDTRLKPLFCKCISPDVTGGVCDPEIQDEEWQNYDESVYDFVGGVRMYGLLIEDAYMICIRGGGLIYASDDGQRIPEMELMVGMRRNWADLEGLRDEFPDTPLYNDILNNIMKITTLNPDFDIERDRFRDTYLLYQMEYEAIAKAAGVPPELIAIIHYRENTQDYFAGTFGVYLHNGNPLGKPTVDVPVGKNFSNFQDAAVDAINDKSSSVSKYMLTEDSKDIVSMMAFAEVYNGLGYYNNGRISPYLYSGTDIYVSGKYVSDSVYDPNAVDKQIGVYILLKSIL